MNPERRPSEPTRVLVVDDSAFMRHAVRKMLSKDPGLLVVGHARDGVEGLEKAAELKPDVITLDIEMPKLDGMQMLERLMAEQPLPVVMLSTLTQEGAEATLEALELGAVDFVPKPTSGRLAELEEIEEGLLRAVRAAAMSRVDRRPVGARRKARGTSPRAGGENSSVAQRLVVIGSSTGGPPALTEVIPQLPAALEAAMVVVQHMPPAFTTSLAERLNNMSALGVSEAQGGEVLHNNHVYIAPGGVHLALGTGLQLQLSHDATVHGVRPSVDYFLKSVPETLAPRMVVAILTGMGRDGAAGAARIRAAGGMVIAQDEQTSVVYGMPRAVAELGAANAIVPLGGVASAIQEGLRGAAAA